MANTDSPFGLKPVGHLDGSPFNGKVSMYLIPSSDGTAVFIGDLVQAGGSAGSAGTVVNGIDVEGMPTAIQSVAAQTDNVGVVVGFLPNFSDLTVKHRVASTNRIALVADAPDVVYEIQEDSDSAALAADDVGENADIVVGTGNATTGVSAMELDSSTHTSGAATLRILRLAPRPDNAIGNQAKWHVVINEHAYKTTSGT